MNFSKYFGEILLYLAELKRVYQFNKSKKYVVMWGAKSYGYPLIRCYDTVSTLSVGNYVSIARNVSILLGANHRRGLITTYPRSRFNSKVDQQEANERGNVIIGNDVWIGYGATIIGEVTIGNGAIIGAGAVVVSDIPPYSVAVGVPAKVVKYRFSEDVVKELQRLKWWDRDQEELLQAEELLYSDDVYSFLKKLG